MKICETCDKEFDPVNERPSHPARYCCRECAFEAQRTKVVLTCRQCGKEFQRKAYMKDWSKDRGPFCGFQCYGQWQKENTCGPKSPSYVATSPTRGASQIVRNRELAKKRDGYKCTQCGSVNRLHGHHKIPWKPGQKNPHRLGNLVTLCASCHRKLHPVPHAANGRFLRIR